MNVLALVLLLATVLPTGSSRPGGASQVDAAAPTGSCERDDADGGSHKGGGVGQTRADDNYATLVGWLEKGGVEITGVTGRVSSAGGGRGMYATKPLGPGELLFSIPRNFWFSDKTVATASAVGHVLHNDEVVARIIPEDSSWGLILALDYERHNPWSPWRPYLAGLPDPTSPVFWSDIELASLQSPLLKQEVLALKGYIKEMHSHFFPYLFDQYPAMFDTADHTLDSFTWSAMTVWGRSFDLGTANDTATVWGLVPLADYFNHRPFVENNYAMDHMFCDFQTSESTAAGDEIVISYGFQKTTFHYLVFYGFVPTGYQHGDYVTINLIPVPAPAPIPARAGTAGIPAVPPPPSEVPSVSHAFGEGDGAGEVWTIPVGPDGCIHEHFLIKLVAAVPLSPGHDLDEQWSVVLVGLLRVVRRATAGWPTTLADDGALLESPGLSHDRTTAVATRVRFKTIVTTLEANLEHRIARGASSTASWLHPADPSLLVYTMVAEDRADPPLEDGLMAKEALFSIVVPALKNGVPNLSSF